MKQPEDTATRREWQIRALGEWTVWRGDTEVHLTRRGQRVLALLMLKGPTSRGRVASTLWPDTTDSRASASLRTAVLELRRRCPDLITIDNGVLSLGHPVTTDVAALRAALVHGGSEESVVRYAFYLLGVKELLPGWYEEWVLDERADLRENIIDHISQVLRTLIDQGDADQRAAVTVPLARRLMQLEPLRESAHRAMVEIHFAGGDRVSAWQVYDEFRQRSIREFGVAPSAQFEDLIEPLRGERQARRVAFVPHGKRDSRLRPVLQSRRGALHGVDPKG